MASGLPLRRNNQANQTIAKVAPATAITAKTVHSTDDGPTDTLSRGLKGLVGSGAGLTLKFRYLICATPPSAVCAGLSCNGRARPSRPILTQ